MRVDAARDLCSEHVHSFALTMWRAEMTRNSGVASERRREKGGAAGRNSPATSNAYQKLRTRAGAASQTAGREELGAERRTECAATIQISHSRLSGCQRRKQEAVTLAAEAPPPLIDRADCLKMAPRLQRAEFCRVCRRREVHSSF